MSHLSGGWKKQLAVNVLTHRERAGREKMKGKYCRWKTSEEVTECEDREATQLASAQRIHFVGATNQSVLCESESTTCVCNETAASAHSVGTRSKWIAVQVNTPTGADLESILLLIHLSSLFSLFNKHLC